MSESKHTPGPWFVDESGDVRQSRERSEEERRAGRCAGFRVAICAFGASDPSNGADARLIAAAPDGHELLTYMRERLRRYGEFQMGPRGRDADLLARLDAYFRKATGGEQ